MTFDDITGAHALPRERLPQHILEFYHMLSIAPGAVAAGHLGSLCWQTRARWEAVGVDPHLRRSYRCHREVAMKPFKRSKMPMAYFFQWIWVILNWTGDDVSIFYGNFFCST